MTTGRLLTTKVVEQKGQSALQLDTAEIRVVAGPDRKKHVVLAAAPLRIGTGETCELQLTDPSVSALHAEIRLRGEGYTIRDLRSKNGVRIAGYRVDGAPLVDGMRIELGETTLQVKTSEKPIYVPLAPPGRCGRLVAYSVAMRAFVAQLRVFSASAATILLEGETGTGKEIAAETIHELSPRASGPFVTFDCGAVAPHLMASELFGVERGAYTDAQVTRTGLFEDADGGTIFLDEIGELPLDLQPVLLRVLDSLSVRRVGGRKESRHDVRVITGTNRNLEHEVKQGRFRSDLFFRIAVARMHLPPLRERADDLTQLALDLGAEAGIALSPELLALIGAHEWTGNVRELRNFITRSALDPSARLATASGTALANAQPLGPLSEARREAIEEFERSYLDRALAMSDNSVSKAAELAGVSRQFLTRLLAKYRGRG